MKTIYFLLDGQAQKSRYWPSLHMRPPGFFRRPRFAEPLLLPARFMELLCPRLNPRGPPIRFRIGCDGSMADLSHRREAPRPPQIRTSTVPAPTDRSCRYARNRRANVPSTLRPKPKGWALVVMSSHPLLGTRRGARSPRTLSLVWPSYSSPRDFAPGFIPTKSRDLVVAFR